MTNNPIIASLCLVAFCLACPAFSALTISDDSVVSVPNESPSVEEQGSVPAEKESSDASDVLDDRYNLGRIVAQAVTSSGICYLRDGVAMFADGLHLQHGVNNSWSLGETFVPAIFIGEFGGFLLALPEVDFKAAIGPSNRISCMLLPTNVSFLSIDNSSATGFQAPFYMINAYGWELLTRKGQISLAPDQMENAFYFKPLVNQGQFRLMTNLSHSLGETTMRYPEILDFFSAASFGIADNIQASAAFRSSNRTSEAGATLLGEESPIYSSTTLEDDSMMVLGKFDFRYKSLAMQCGYRFNRLSFDPYYWDDHTLFIDASHLFGTHIASVAQVRGNWDGYFTPMLGAGQLLAQAGFDMDFESVEGNSDYGEPSADYTCILHNELRYGLARFLTLGERLNIRAGNSMTPVYDLFLDAIAMNIPLREKGPAEVSGFEYLYGYLPRRGQARFEASLRIPLQKRSVYNDAPPSLFQNAASGSVLGLALTDRQLLDQQWMQIDPIGSKFASDDFFFKFSVGITDAMVISNSFDLRTDHYLISDYGIYSRPASVNSSNTLWADGLGFSYIRPDEWALTMGISFFGQTDARVSGRDKNDFLISVLLREAL